MNGYQFTLYILGGIAAVWYFGTVITSDPAWPRKLWQR